MCVIECLEPDYPGRKNRPGAGGDWYFVLPMTPGVGRTWVRGHRLEIISESK